MKGLKLLCRSCCRIRLPIKASYLPSFQSKKYMFPTVHTLRTNWTTIANTNENNNKSYLGYYFLSDLEPICLKMFFNLFHQKWVSFSWYRHQHTVRKHFIHSTRKQLLVFQQQFVSKVSEKWVHDCILLRLASFECFKKWTFCFSLQCWKTTRQGDWGLVKKNN